MLRPWDLNFAISRESPQPIHQQLSAKLIQAIHSGAFGAGVPLPGTRELSQRLGINRKTVIRVYEELTAHGWLYTEGKRGTFVSHQPPVAKTTDVLSTLHLDHLHLLALQQENAIQTHETGSWMDLSYPHGDHRIFNFEALIRATRHAIITTKRMGHETLHQPFGLQALRHALAQMLNFEQGLTIAPQQLCIVPTAHTSLDVVAKAIFKKGDYLLLEELHEVKTSSVFQYHTIHIQTVKHHAQGIDLGDLEKLCINYPVRAIYVSPNCQQPTTTRMTAENRTQLIKLAKRYGFYIIEDNTRAQFSYERTAPASLASLAQQQVIHIGSLAHLMNASYKAAYMSVPQQLLTSFEQVIDSLGDSSNLINELTLTELLLSGEVKKQLKRAQKLYQERRDYCCKHIQQELGDYVSFEKPSAGFAIWLQTKQIIAPEKLEAQLHQQQIKLNAETAYYQNQAGQTSFAIHFAHLNFDELKLAVKRIKLAFSTLKTPALYAAYG